MLLPPSLVAGILGVNVGGIPGARDSTAFYELLGILAGLMVVQFIVFKWIKWI